MQNLTHVNPAGKANMVDVGHKEITRRVAMAQGKIFLSPMALGLLKDNQLKKGDALAVAHVAGIQAAKRTAELIPLCHPLLLDNIHLDLLIEDDGVRVTSTVHCVGRTGVEMEALTAVSIALLSVYDMCKAVDKTMSLGEIRLLKKEKNNVSNR